MSAQESATEIFGSDRMWGLKELPAPPAISWMPQTWGWAMVAVLAIAGIAWLVWQRWKAYQADQYRRDGLERLSAIKSKGEGLHEVPQLLRVAALGAGARADVASLRGGDWINWLNARLPSPVFEEADSTVFDMLAYGAKDAVVPEAQANHILEASETWLRGHRAEL